MNINYHSNQNIYIMQLLKGQVLWVYFLGKNDNTQINIIDIVNYDIFTNSHIKNLSLCNTKS